MMLSSPGIKKFGLLALITLIVAGFFAFAAPSFAEDESDDPDREAERHYDEDDDDYKRWLEVRARQHAEYHDCDHDKYCDCIDDYYRHYKPEPAPPSKVHSTNFHIGLLFSPENRNGVNAFGIECLDLDDNPIGGTLWLAGDPGFFFTGQEIDAYIPHDDYTTYSNTGEVGFVLELPLEIDNDFWLVLGGGLTIQSTHYTDVSNVTDWEWDGGSETGDIFPSGQVSLLFRLGETGAVRIGYDSHYEWFFGILF